MEHPDYARTRRGAQVAFTVCGGGDGLPLIYLPGFLYSIESIFEDAPYARLIQGLARNGPVALLERQGVGVSDPLDDASDLWEQWADDVVAVIDAMGVERAAVMGYGPSAALALEAALRFPDRVAKVVAMSPHFQIGDDELEHLRQEVQGNVARDDTAEQAALSQNVPSRASEQAYLDWNARAGRLGSGPSAARAFWDAVLSPTGLATRLSGIECPVLFLVRSGFDRFGDPVATIEAATTGIRDRQVRELEGDDLIPNAGDVDALVFEVVEFLHGADVASSGSRVLGVLMFSDIVGSTTSAARAGDADWAQLLDQHDLATRRLLRRHGGVMVTTTGDGALMCFDEPSRALECAVALRRELRVLGLATRIGVHVGEFERRGSDVAGVAVHLTERVMSKAAPDQIVTTAVVPLATLGSDARFESLGAHELKGFEGAFELYSLVVPD